MLKIAAVTQVKNEPVFLPLWIRHYGGHFGEENLFVIDDGTTDGSTQNLGAPRVLARPTRPFDEQERASEIAALLEELLKFHDWVIYTDVDEFLVLDPLLKLSFPDYLQKVSGRHLNAVGINVLHNVDSEAQYSPHIPVFRQRRFGALDRHYFKQLIHSYRVLFLPGFHYSNRGRNFAPGLYLMHLARFDRESTRQRWLVRNSISWSKNATLNGHSEHFRTPVDEYLATIYGHDAAGSAAATEPGKFSARVVDFLSRVEKETSGNDFAATLEYQSRIPMLTFPERFSDTIAAATSPFSALELAAQTSHSPTRPFDPAALYSAALARVYG